jgi:restriction system protein
MSFQWGVFQIMRKKRKQKPFESIVQLSAIVLGLTVLVFTEDIIAAIIAGISTVIAAMIWKLSKTLSYRTKLRKSNINEIDSMDGVQFEHYLKELYKSKGYRVELTPTTGDFGADLILNKDGKRFVVQAKRYSKPVGIKAVQEVVSAIKMYRATEAWVVTNNVYTKAAIELAKTHDVVLIGREQLIDLIYHKSPEDKPYPNPIEVKREIKQETKKKCEECGSEMLIRNGSQGIFYGCSKFPHCRHTKVAL